MHARVCVNVHPCEGACIMGVFEVTLHYFGSSYSVTMKLNVSPTGRGQRPVLNSPRRVNAYGWETFCFSPARMMKVASLSGGKPARNQSAALLSCLKAVEETNSLMFAVLHGAPSSSDSATAWRESAHSLVHSFLTWH